MGTNQSQMPMLGLTLEKSF